MSIQPPAVAGRIRFWRQVLAVGKWIAEREELQRDDNEPSTRRSGFSPLTWLASPDQLPNGSQPPRPDRSFFGWLPAREVLPTASSERTPGSRSILRWLLTSEDHDRLENLHSIKEVPPNEP